MCRVLVSFSVPAVPGLGYGARLSPDFVTCLVLIIFGKSVVSFHHDKRLSRFRTVYHSGK